MGGKFLREGWEMVRVWRYVFHCPFSGIQAALFACKYNRECEGWACGCMHAYIRTCFRDRARVFVPMCVYMYMYMYTHCNDNDDV